MLTRILAEDFVCGAVYEQDPPIRVNAAPKVARLLLNKGLNKLKTEATNRCVEIVYEMGIEVINSNRFDALIDRH